MMNRREFLISWVSSTIISLLRRKPVEEPVEEERVNSSRKAGWETPWRVNWFIAKDEEVVLSDKVTK